MSITILFLLPLLISFIILLVFYSMGNSHLFCSMQKFSFGILACMLLLCAGIAGAQISGVSCERYQTGAVNIPAGFGLPWQPDYLPNELALKASCDGQN